VLILLAGEVMMLQGCGAEEQTIGAEAAGGLIAETAGLAPAPRFGHCPRGSERDAGLAPARQCLPRRN